MAELSSSGTMGKALVQPARYRNDHHDRKSYTLDIDRQESRTEGLAVNLAPFKDAYLILREPGFITYGLKHSSHGTVEEYMQRQ